MGQMYTNDVHFMKFYPMQWRSDAPDTLVIFMQDIGIPSELHSDDAKELTLGRMGELVKKYWIKGTQSEPYSPWQVHAELCIREVKKVVRHTLDKMQAPRRLWDYCIIYQYELRNLIAHPYFKLHGRTPYKIITGYTPDISEYLDYSWYQTIWYYDEQANFPEPRRRLAKWLGVAHRVGQALCFYILPESGITIVHSTIQALTREEIASSEVLEQIKMLDCSINIAAAVLLLKDGVLVPAKVTGKKRDGSRNPVGIGHRNPILDTRVYNFQFEDGHTEEYAVNIIVNWMSQVNIICCYKKSPTIILITPQ